MRDEILSVLGIEPTKNWSEPRESESTSELVVNINDKTIYTNFKKLSSFICTKLQTASNQKDMLPI